MPTKQATKRDREIEQAAEALKTELKKLKQAELHADEQERNNEWVGKRARERETQINASVQEGIRLHDDLKTKAEEMIKTAQSGFETFASAMSSILELTTRLAEVLHKNSVFSKFSHKVSTTAMPVVDTVAARIASWVKDKFKDDKFDLPKLKHNVHFEGNGFRVDDVTGGLPGLSDETRGAVNNAFKHGIELWLERCNYEKKPGTDPAQYQDKDSKALLTENKFNALKDNGDLSLDRFLSGQFQMDVEETARPPSP